MSSTPTVADMTAAYAQDAVDHAKAKFQTELDFSPESVEQLEGVLDQIHDTIPTGFLGKVFRALMKGSVETMSKMYGYYLGEVIRRHAGGAWIVTENGVTLTKADARVWPTAKVYKRITNGAEDNVAVYFKVLLDEHWPRTDSDPETSNSS
jgi:hypothetical protein